MALLNIGSVNKDDAFYRYKMPKMQTKTEGCGNGIKTKVENMDDIAKALRRPGSYTTKYLGCQLGALSKFHEETGTAVINGQHHSAKLAAVLETFINKFVQCYGCGNPETDIFVTRTKTVNLNCIAYGFVSKVDMREKLTNFILKVDAKKGSKDDKKKMKMKKNGTSNNKVSSDEVKGVGSGASRTKKSNEDDDDDVKSWCNIIDSSTFAESHLQNQSGESLLLQSCKWYPWDVSILNPDNGKNHKSFPAFHKFANDNFGGVFLFFSGSVNGLFCVYTKCSVRVFGLPILIYNPCLDKIKTLPLPPIRSLIGCPPGTGSCTRSLGFGFDYITKDYKVVQLLQFWSAYGLRRTCVDVYSRRTNAWMELSTKSLPADDLYLCHIHGIASSAYARSSLAHWQVMGQDSRPYGILSFNMQNEVFKTTWFPNFEDRKVDVTSCVVFAKDDDSFTLYVYTCDHCTLEAWELDNERCWTHVRDVNVQGRNWSLPRALWKTDGVVFTEKERNSIFYSYSAEKVMKRFEMPKMYQFVSSNTFEYKGSLILP